MLTALHILTHVGLSWLVANLCAVSRRDRGLILLAGVLPDLDGMGILWNDVAYAAAHRVLGHSLVFGLMLVALITGLAIQRGRTAVLSTGSFHLHLLLDAVGTGGPPIRYFWPGSDWGWAWSGHWELGSWENMVVMAGTLLGILWIGRTKGRTPVECVSVRADQVIVRALRCQWPRGQPPQ